MNNYQQSVKPIKRVRDEIIRECEGDGYLIMKMLYNLSKDYYDREHKKYS